MSRNQYQNSFGDTIGSGSGKSKNMGLLWSNDRKIKGNSFFNNSNTKLSKSSNTNFITNNSIHTNTNNHTNSSYNNNYNSG